MSYKNRKKEYERLVAGKREVPEVLLKEFANKKPLAKPEDKPKKK